MRPGAGPPAEPARQLTRAGGGTPPAARRLTCGKRRAASASARRPRPHSLTRSVSPTEGEALRWRRIARSRAGDELARWPRWRWEGPSWWQTVAGSILAAAAVLAPALGNQPAVVRVAAIVAAFVAAPLLVLTSVYIARIVRIVVLRVLTHERMGQALNAVREELVETKRMLTSIVQSRSELPVFEVERVERHGDEIYINVSFSITELNLGDRLALVDTEDAMMFGEFEVASVKRNGYQARGAAP